MKQRLLIILLLISAISITFAACDDNESASNGGGSRHNAGINILAPGDTDPITYGDRFKGTGQIVYNSFEGGFYGIVDDNGENYYPLNLPEKFRHSGMKVDYLAAKAVVQETHVIWGTAIYIFDISGGSFEGDR